MKSPVHRKSQGGRRRERAVQPKMHITKGDRVRVMTGEDAGTEGAVIRVVRKLNRVVVEGVNIVTKHKRATASDEGGIIKFPAPIHASNVMLIDPKSHEPPRVRR